MKCVAVVGVAIISLLSLAGCGGDAQHPSFLTRVGRSTGLADPAPRPTITIDVVCDPSRDGTCTADSLAATLSAALPVIAERPASELRLWIIGPDLASMKRIPPVKGTVSNSGNAATVKAATARFVEDRRSSCMSAAQPGFAQPGKGGSPIAESLTAIAMASVHTDLRAIVVVSDAREVSAIGGDFECDDPLPNPPSFVKSLQRVRVLPPGSLAGTRVFFTFMTITEIHRKGCAETLDRLATMRDLWTAAIEAAGGTLQFDTGVIDTNAIATKDKGDN
jgi:hypothetical protein